MKENQMKTEIYKPYQIFFLVLASCFLNAVGRILAEKLNLPLWLDSFGTVLTAYVLGPVCGIIVGVSGNIIHGFVNPVSFVYALASIFIALVVGIMARRGWMNTLLKTMSLSVCVTLISTVISVVLNITFYGGNVGNEWGNGIIEEFSAWGVPRPVCYVLGQFYIDFLDKVITLVALFACIKAYRFAKPKLPKILKSTPPVLILISLSLFAPEKSFAAPRTYNSFAHTIYNRENGLVGGKANDIASTNDGILWIGTYEGLYRYNGIEFRMMREFESIKAVRCLYVDDEGRLFVGTNDNGLSIVINETVMNVLESKDGLPTDYVRCITRGSDGLYYVGTSDSLAVVTIADGLGVVSTVPEIQNAVSITSDDDNHIAAVSGNGTLFVAQKGSVFWSSQNTKNTQDINEKFTAVTFSPNGTLYASTESNKLYSFKIEDNDDNEADEDNSETVGVENSVSCGSLRHVNSIRFFDDTLFLCADNGAGFFQDGIFHILETDFFNNSIDNMTEDYQGNLWFTSSRLGLLKMCETPFTELYASSSLPVSVVNSTAVFDGTLYFGTDNGLMALDEKTNKTVRNVFTEQLAESRVRCLLSAKDGSFWIATKQKGLLHAKKDGSIAKFAKGHQTRVVTELSDGTIAAGTNDGILFIKDGSEFQWLGIEDGFENPVILSIGEAKNGKILAGTDGGGLAVIERDSDSYKITRLIKRADGLSSNVVMRTVTDFDGENATGGIFVVTSNGLCYLDFSYDDSYRFTGKDKDFSCRVLSNFPYSNNYDVIVRENKNIFVLSSAGIFVVNRDELLSGQKIDYELLDMKKGLRGSLTANSWNYLDENGNLYLSCDTGSNRLNLNSYNKEEHSYRMQIKSVLLDGKRHIVQKDIPFMIPADCNTVEIVPEIINYSLNTPYISLFFEDVDDKPQLFLQSELSSLIYTNLKSGDYKFDISVLDSKGRDSIENASYTFSKSFRIYDYWWFTFYTLAVAALAIVWLTWYATSIWQGRRIEKQKAEMEAIRNQVRMGNETIFAIANAVEARDKSTGKHSYRVSEYAVLIAKELGFSEDEQNQIRRTGLLHDIGKIGVPDSILNKPSGLTDEEYEIMKTHTLIGGEILKDFTLISHVDEGAKYHHEHYDGSGYPNGLKGEEIPLNARIIGIADAFDAMTASRCYRNALDMDFVISELKRCAGHQFDAGLVEIMLELIENGQLNVEKTVKESVEK
ncbi:MAG: HD domain-containing protein [Treponema sp.]|nr:HD domain-containing protein [Treponema sp.]